MRPALLVIVLWSILLADRITYFRADSYKAEPGSEIKLSIGLDVTKMYELYLQAFDDKTSQQLQPTFRASTIHSMIYRVPADNRNPIKLKLELVEQGKVVDTKTILLQAPDDYGRYLYFCSIFGQEGLGKHSRYTKCFRPKPNVEYKLVYGDDPGIPLFMDSSRYAFYYRGNTYNVVVLGNTKIHYFNLPLTVIGTNTYNWSCYYGCCTYTYLGYASAIDCLSSSDTEDIIYATYEKEKKRIKIRFTGGYYPCSCYWNNCCGNYRTNIGYIYLWSM